MSVLDTFFLLYKADTKDATSKIEALEEAAKKPGDATDAGGKKGKSALELLGKGFKRTGEEAKEFGKDVAAQLGSVSGGLGNVLGLVGRLGPAFAIGAAGAAILARGIKEANKAAEDAKKHRDAAWASDMDVDKYIRLQVIGERQGISNEEMGENIRGMNEKMKSAWMAVRPGVMPDINNPDYRRAMLLRQRGVQLRTNAGNVADAEDIYNQMVKSIRTIARRPGKKGGEEKAMAVAVQEFGMTFNAAQKIIKATDEQIKQATQSLEKETVSRQKLQAESQLLLDAQNRLQIAENDTSRAIQQQTVPAMTSLISELTKTQANGESLATTLGKIGAAMINATAKVAGFIAHFLPNEVDEIRKTGELQRGSKYWEEAAKEVLDQKRAQGESWWKTDFASGVYNPEIQELALKKLKADPNSKWNIQQREKESRRVEEVQAKAKELRPKFDKFTDAQYAEKVTEAIKGGAEVSTLEGFLKSLLRLTSEGNAVATANWKETAMINHKTPQIGTSLEQAMALWAAGVGKGANLALPEEASKRGTTRREYESAWWDTQRKYGGQTYVPAERVMNVGRPAAVSKPVAFPVTKPQPKEKAPPFPKPQPKEKAPPTMELVFGRGETFKSPFIDGIGAIEEHWNTLAKSVVDAQKVGAASAVAERITKIDQSVTKVEGDRTISIGSITITTAAKDISGTGEELVSELTKALRQLVNSNSDPVVN